MVQKVNFNNLTGDTLTVGNTVITGTGVTVSGSPLSGGSGGATQYANTSQLPKQDLTFGEFALIGNTLFITNGVGWYSVGVINQSPSLSISVSDISLGAIGNTINFTYTATDPDGPTPTVTAELVGANTEQANVNLYTSNSTVTVENLSATDFSANIVLTATDGIDQTFGTVTLNVMYLSELWDETVLSIGTSSTNSLNNSTIVDGSTNAHTFTKAGTPTQTAFHPYLDNWSVDFDGSSNGWIRDATSSGDYTFGTGDFTIELFVNFDTIADAYLWSAYDGANGGFALWFSSSNGLSIRYGDNAIVQRAWSPNAGQWYHIAIARESGTMKMFVDGTLLGTSFSYTTDIQHVLALGSFIGKYNLDGGQVGGYFNGKISNLRIVKGSAVYTANFNKPTENLTDITNTVLLTCQSRSFIDNSSFAQSFTLGSGVSVSAYNPFGQESEYAVGENRGSAKFGSGDSLTRATTGFYTVTSFCIEFWIYPLSDQSHYICEGTQQGSGTWRITIDSSGGGVGFSYAAGSWAGVNFGTGSGDFNSHEWTHIAITKTSAGVYRIFINGVQKGTQTNTSSLINTARNFQFGYYVDGTGTSYSNALYSDFKITRQDPVYTSDFTVPTAPVGGTNVSINDPYMYLPFDNAGIFDKTSNHTPILLGSTSTSTTQTKYADTSIYFDGNDQLRLDDVMQTLGSGNIFTIEMWFWISGSVTALDTNTLIGINRISDAQNLTLVMSGSTGIWANAAQRSGISSAMVSQQWQHLAYVCDNTEQRFYVDGNLEYTYGSPINWNPEDAFLAVGVEYDAVNHGSPGNWLTGYIENIQVSRIAKYTTNFTPPTTTQGRIYQAES